MFWWIRRLVRIYTRAPKVAYWVNGEKHFIPNYPILIMKLYSNYLHKKPGVTFEPPKGTLLPR